MEIMVYCTFPHMSRWTSGLSFARDTLSCHASFTLYFTHQLPAVRTASFVAFILNSDTFSISGTHTMLTAYSVRDQKAAEAVAFSHRDESKPGWHLFLRASSVE